MSQDRWIDIETAKKLLKKVCYFLEIDKSGVADFKITNGKEAVLMSLYTEASFLFNEKYKFKFRPVADAFHAREPLTLIPFQEEVWSSSEVAPIFVEPLSMYFKFFPDLVKPKYLFMVNAMNYSKKKYDYSGKPYYELYKKDKIIKDILEKIRANNIRSTDCLIWISNPDGTYSEDFWEYVSGVVLREKGYFVTYYSLGGGDLYAYYIPDYIEKLIKNNFLNKGAFIEELEMFGIFNETKSTFTPSKTKYESIVVEAESSEMRTRSCSENAGVGQVLKYLLDWKAGYTSAFVSGPFTKITDIYEKYRDKIGLISCDEDGNLIFSEPSTYKEPSEDKIEIIKNLIKCSLLRNLSFEERCKLIGISPTNLNLNEYFDKILSLDIDRILEKIREKLKI